MNLQRDEIVLIDVPFHQRQGSKIRPAVVLLDSADDDLVAAPVTSRQPRDDLELRLLDWRASGLVMESVVRAHKIAVISKAVIRRRLGALSDRDLAGLTELLCRLYCR